MRHLRETFCLVIPCYNEEARLDATALTGLPLGCRSLFVNDGSTDGTSGILKAHVSDTVSLLELPVNQGKAEAVRQGVLYAARAGLLDDVEWIGYWDADMATPLSEASRLIDYALTFQHKVDGILGSRVYKLGSRITRSYRRHIAARVFATLADSLLATGCYDSQCGAKLFRKELVERAFGEPFISEWVFDLEVLLRLRDYHLVEYPLQIWTDIKGSKVGIGAAPRVIIDLLRIRAKYRRSSPS